MHYEKLPGVYDCNLLFITVFIDCPKALQLNQKVYTDVHVLNSSCGDYLTKITVITLFEVLVKSCCSKHSVNDTQ